MKYVFTCHFRMVAEIVHHPLHPTAGMFFYLRQAQHIICKLSDQGQVILAAFRGGTVFPEHIIQDMVEIIFDLPVPSLNFRSRSMWFLHHRSALPTEVLPFM